MPGNATGLGIVNLKGADRSNLRLLDIEEVDVVCADV